MTMHELEQLCREIDMPQAMTARLRSVEPERRFTAGLCDPDGYEQATERLRLALGDDPDGVKILAAMSVAAAHTRQMYRDRDIPPSVFIDTMRCFSRFVREYAESFGRYGFDRWFWTGRQLSCTLFRLGALEYETIVENGSKMLSLHIPSDADLSDRAVEDSLRLAKTFFDTYERSYASAPIVCSSWLLSPALAALLPSDAKILRFARRFEICETYPDDTGYKQWLFKNPSLAPQDFAEKTSLQRNAKRLVLAGGKIGAAKGVLRGDTC